MPATPIPSTSLAQRYTWVKLASPYVEALRQAFIANDSRLRIGFERNDDGAMRPIGDSPDVTLNNRPWLEQVDIHGTASFFGTKGSTGSPIRLGPDVTCIIGGSMTGKSTFLDGLRLYVGAPLPNDKSLRDQVEIRGRDIFGAGSPVVEIDCPGSDPTAPIHERWPAQFFAQNELQRLAIEASAVEDILARLVPTETRGIEERDKDLRELDKQCDDMTKRLADLDDSLAEAEQARARQNRQGRTHRILGGWCRGASSGKSRPAAMGGSKTKRRNHSKRYPSRRAGRELAGCAGIGTRSHSRRSKKI